MISFLADPSFTTMNDVTTTDGADATTSVHAECTNNSCVIDDYTTITGELHLIAWTHWTVK